ncbi:MAG: nucleotidyltransferase domain-containing protein [Thermodesulfobacteriota bacterium]|nr:nucleotidyltransferase domain-containing protein [Thermodesulfobacteriota bacterium]MEA1968797.1 nucleotidyltransferase domain-containing protein [Thermodesulfobacteriota bacterium]
MVEIPDKILKIINQFIAKLEDNHIKVERAFLFGSYAQGTFNDWSDIDLAIVSTAFKGERFGDRDKIRRIKLSISCDLEPIPYNPLDFNSNNPFVKRILRTGIRVV